MSDEQVETTAPEQAAPVTPAPASTPVPATTPPEDFETKVKAAEEKVRREEQSKRDRQAAELHRQYQERERAILQKAKQRLVAVGDNTPDALETEVADAADIAEYRAWKQKSAAEQSTKQMAATICQEFGLDPSDARLDGKNYASWAEYSQTVAKLAAQDARKKAEAEKEAEAKRATKAANERVESGELATLPVTSAGASSAEDLKTKYQKEMLASRGKGMATGQAIKEKYRKLGVPVDTVVLR